MYKKLYCSLHLGVSNTVYPFLFVLFARKKFVIPAMHSKKVIHMQYSTYEYKLMFHLLIFLFCLPSFFIWLLSFKVLFWLLFWNSNTILLESINLIVFVYLSIFIIFGFGCNFRVWSWSKMIFFSSRTSFLMVYIIEITFDNWEMFF